MLNKFQKTFTELTSIIEHGEYNKLSECTIEVPDKFNWVRDVFEPLIVHAHANRNMLELVTDNPSEAVTLLISRDRKMQPAIKFFAKAKCTQGDGIFIMCGLNEGLWISYLSLSKVGLF